MSLPDLSRSGPKKIKDKRRDARPRARRYATSSLESVLKIPSSEMSLKVARGGGSSLVYILSTGEKPRAVVYLIPGYKNWRDMRDALETGAEHDLPFPRLLHSDGNPIRAIRGRYQYLTTDFAEGKPLDDVRLTPALVEVLADTVARLHGLESDHWGKIRRPQNGSIKADWKATIAKRMVGIRSHPEAPKAGRLREFEAWFEAQLEALPEPRRYQMCHHHLAGDDIIVAPDGGKMTIIDCGDLQYSRAARDLACIREEIFLKQGQLWPAFLDRYFSHFKSPVRAEWERELPFFTALYHLFKVRSTLGTRRHPHFLGRLTAACGILPGPK